MIEDKITISAVIEFYEMLCRVIRSRKEMFLHTTVLLEPLLYLSIGSVVWPGTLRLLGMGKTLINYLVGLFGGSPFSSLLDLLFSSLLDLLFSIFSSRSSLLDLLSLSFSATKSPRLSVCVSFFSLSLCFGNQRKREIPRDCRKRALSQAA